MPSEFDPITEIEVCSKENAHHSILSTTVSDDGQYLLVGTEDSCIFVYLKQELHQKLIAFKLQECGLLYQIRMSPCNNYIIVFSLQVQEEVQQYYKLIIIDFQNSLIKLKTDNLYKFQCFSSMYDKKDREEKLCFQLQNPKIYLEYSFPQQFLVSDYYIYKIIFSLFTMKKQKTICIKCLVQTYSDIFHLNIDIVQKEIQIHSLIQNNTDIQYIEVSKINMLQDSQLYKNNILFLQIASTLVVLQKDINDVDEKFYLTQKIDTQRNNEDFEQFDTIQSIQQLQSFLLKEGNTYYNSLNDYLNEKQLDENDLQLQQIIFQNTEDQICCLNINKSTEQLNQQLINLDYNFLNLQINQQNQCYIDKLQLFQVQLIISYVYDLYSFNKNIVQINDNLIISKKTLTQLTNTQSKEYLVQQINLEAVNYSSNYITLRSTSSVMNRSTRDKEDRHVYYLVKLDQLIYQNYAASFNGFRVTNQNVLYYEREDEYDLVEDTNLYGIREKFERRSTDIIKDQVQGLLGFQTDSQYVFNNEISF